MVGRLKDGIFTGYHTAVLLRNLADQNGKWPTVISSTDQLIVLLTPCVIIDPVTQGWLASNKDPVFGFPSLVRFSWSTAANILSDSLPVKWLVVLYLYSFICLTFREDDDGDSTGSAKITQFFSSKTATTQRNEHKYFRERCLKPVTCL